MATIAARYEALPSLQAATNTLESFDFDKVRDSVGELLLPYGEQYGMCLIHRHFSLNEDEVMADDGLVMKPHTLNSKEFYPKRWDRNGNVYEFSTVPQHDISAALLEAFRAIVPENASLGLYSRQGDDEDQNTPLVEECQVSDRSHHLVPRQPEHDGALETAWYTVQGQPIMRGCGKTCRQKTTRQGVAYGHETTWHAT